MNEDPYELAAHWRRQMGAYPAWYGPEDDPDERESGTRIKIAPRNDDELEYDGPSIEALAESSPRTTDSANADAFVAAQGKGFLFVSEWGAWIGWTGKRWERLGARNRVLNAAMLTARHEYMRTLGRLKTLEGKQRQVALAGQRDEDLELQIAGAKHQLKWHEQSQNLPRLEAVTRILETRLVVVLHDLDKNPWLLNVANGTVDLRTADLRPHDPTDLLTQITDVEWQEGASCPTWITFVSNVMGGQLDLVLYLQRLVGYAITALTTEHILAFFHGGGRNGKSTFVQTIRTMLGEYACAAPRDLLFEDKSGSRHPAELARLYGKRIAVCAEIGEHTVLDEAKVKDLTGGDTVAVRRMREDFWDLEPTHTLFLSGNHKPIVRGDDLGIWRRIRLIPWTVTVDIKDVDTELPEKLRRELPGILWWAVSGCLEWQRIGLCEPAVVLDATRDYRAESDVLGEFLSQHVVFGRGEACSREALRKRYETWCEEAGHHPLGAKKIAQRLRERNVETANVRDGMRVKNGWRGCRLKSDYELQADA